MKFLKKPSVALLLCVLIVICSTLVNTRVKFGALCREKAQTFYAEGSIASQLSELHDEAGTLARLAESKGQNASALRDASALLQEMLNRGNLSAGQLYPYYSHLNETLKDVETKLLTAECSEQEAAALSASLEQIHNLQAAIAASSYNDNVRTFCAKNSRFPTGILAKLAGVALPEEFA